MKKILLVGNPNVGKSTIFTRLTGINVITSNYPGTTVEYTKGYLKIKEEEYEVIDTPGAYALNPITKAEEVAIDILNKNKDGIILNILDANNLERHLNLTLQLIKRKFNLIIILNFWDETRHSGVEIDFKKLEKILKVPVIPVCGRTGYGIKDVISNLNNAKISDFIYKNEKDKWQKIGNIIKQVQKLKYKRHTFLDKIEELSIKPNMGLVIALIVLLSTFFIVRFIGENLITFFDFLFNKYCTPFIEKIVNSFVSKKFIQNLLLGTVPKPMESFGILTTGLYLPFVVVFPYIFAFYLLLSILEDIGYMPRLAVLLDRIMHKLGIHGYTAIPIIFGFGCKVPAILSTRILETEREKILTTSLLLLIAPCMPQTAMIISLGTPFGIKYLFLIFIILFVNSLIVNFLLNKILKRETPELFLEIPPYRIPYFKTTLLKLWLRLKNFVYEAIPMIILGIFFVGLLDSLGILTIISNFFEKPITKIMGLPKEIAAVITFGFLRKDVSIALLAPFKLNPKQFVIASIFLTIYLPCLATSFTMIKELKLKNALKVISINLITGMIISFFLNLIL
jgi:ferrous iron transport protein B